MKENDEKLIRDSYSVLKYLTTDNKKWFNMTPFEVLLFVFGMIAMITLPLVLKGMQAGWDLTSNPFTQIDDPIYRAKYNFWDLLFTIAPVFGISGAMMLSTKSKYSWIPLFIEAFMYGAYTFFAVGSYALGSVNMFFAPAILLFQRFVSWNKHTTKDKEEVDTRKIDVTKGLELTALICLVAIGLASIFIFTDEDVKATDWISWIDGLMGSLMLFAYLTSALRYRESWYLFFLANVVKIIAWSIAIGQATDMATVASYSTALTLAIIYLINASFGLIIWQNSKKEELKDIKKL